MRNIALVVSYEGTRYFGFQMQPSGNTIQDHLENAIRKLTGEQTNLHASGRTDAGVHARGQVVNFHTEAKIPVERWALALNSWLPDDIVVLEAKEVDLQFHARKSAISKTYRYVIDCAKFPDVFQRRLRYHHPTPLNVEEMREALTYVVGEHDFTSFCSAKSRLLNKVRTIYRADLKIVRDPHRKDMANAIEIDITGNGFLHNMVRIIVGTLIEIGEGKKSAADMKHILQSQNRSLAGPTAEAHGLMLWKVDYESFA